jgi:hypothetical protein
MRKLLLLKTVFAVAIVSVLASCGKQEAQKPEAKPSAATPAPTPTTPSAEKTSFQEVTSHLDAGGDLYVYLGTEQMLTGVSGRISRWRQVFTSMPDADAERREQIARVFDVVTNLIKDSGLEDVSGFGLSSLATEKGFYRTKAIVHHYPNRGSGLLWKIFGQQPHALTGLDMLPANTAFATFSDLDVPLVWSEVQKQAGRSGFPQAQEFLDKLPAEFEKAAGLKWEQVLNSLGGEFGVVVTLDDSKLIPIPLPTSEKLEIPEPGLMIVAKVKDDTLFNRVEQALNKGGQQIVRVDKPDLKMRTLSLPLPLPIQLRPTIAASGGWLFIASTDSMIQEVLAVKSGQKPGLKAGDEFKRLARDIPQQGNQFSFVSQRFGETIRDVQRQALSMAAKTQPAQQQWLQSFLRSDTAMFSYCVSANSDEGWLSVGNGNQNPAKLLLAGTIIAPIGMLSAIAIPNFVKARQSAQQNACINNLHQIENAKQQWALENNKKSTDVPTQSDIQPFIDRAAKGTSLTCPSGGHYTIGALNESPTCTIPGHALNGN